MPFYDTISDISRHERTELNTYEKEEEEYPFKDSRDSWNYVEIIDGQDGDGVFGKVSFSFR